MTIVPSSSFTHILSARAIDKALAASHGQDRLAGPRSAETQAAVSMLRAAARPSRRLYNT